MASKMTLTITKEDGSTRQVIADQRDSIRFEREVRISVNNALEQMPNAFFWCLAYYAEHRQKLTTLTRDEWESQTLRVDVDTSERADPTQTAALQSSLSSSPSKPASRSRKSRTGQAKS